MISTAHKTKSTMLKQHIFRSTSLLHRIVPSKSCLPSFLTRTTTTTMILMLMMMLSSPTISLSLDENGVELKNNQGITMVQKNHSMRQDQTSHHTIRKWNVRKREDEQDGINHLNNIMTKDIAFVNRNTQENCVETEDQLRSAVNSANDFAATTATVITLCSELIYMNGQIDIDSKNIELNCFLSNKNDKCTLDTRMASRHFYLYGSSVSFNQVAFINGKLSISEEDGGSLYVAYSYATFIGCKFSYNEAADLGGAIFSQGGYITMKKSLMLNNKAGWAGGAMSALGGGIALINTIISGNLAYRGGAIDYWYTNYVTFESTNLTNNKGAAGGAVFSVGNNLLIENSRFSKNTATINGTFLDSRDSNIAITDTVITNFPENSDTGKTVCEIFQQNSEISNDGEIILEGETCQFFPASIFKWVLIDANLDVDISPITLGQIFNFTTIGTNKLSVRLETPSDTKQVVFLWRGNDGRTVTTTETTMPYYMNQNKGKNVFSVPYLKTVGKKTVNATMTSSTGELIGTSTIRFKLTK